MIVPFTEFAPAKINLALHVLARRADGYHEIDSIVAFADVGDELHFTPAEKFALSAAGPFAHFLPSSGSNIIFAAWTAVVAIAEARGRHLPPMAVHVTKNLPVAAGIAGGSADAAAAMRGFLRTAGIETVDQEITAAALAIGADVPACLAGKTSRMQGAGELITPLNDFQPLHAVMINPVIAVQTSDVFRKLGLAAGEHHGGPLADLSDAATWRNDLTAPAIAIAPVIAEVLGVLENQRDLCFARMSGSGATCFGVFHDADGARRAARQLSAAFPRWWVQQASLD